MENYSRKVKSRAKLDESVKQLLKKYEPRHSSARQLFSALDPRIANSELIFSKKFKNPKKIVLLPSKRAYLIPSIDTLKRSPSSASPTKARRLAKEVVRTPKKSMFATELPQTPKPVTGNRLYTIARLSGSPIMESYDKLIRSCSQILPTRNFIFEQEQKRIKRISKNIKNITDDPEENVETKVEIKRVNKKYARYYVSEVLKDLKERKYVSAFSK